MADVELKPCPFCGGEAVTAAEGFGYFSAHCRRCLVVMPAKASREEIAAAWNTRKDAQ